LGCWLDVDFLVNRSSREAEKIFWRT